MAILEMKEASGLAVDISMPQLGESISEGIILKWLKKPGDWVEKYEPICEVETDKVNAEVPSTISGQVKEILVEEGTTIAVGQIICRIHTEEMASTAERDPNESLTVNSLSTTTPESAAMRSRYSPAVMRLSQEHQIDLKQVQGTGKRGRITRKDVLHYLSQRKTTATMPEQKAIQQVGETTNFGDQEIPLSNVRRAIADRMMKSKKEIPHAWIMMEADVTGLVELRNKEKKAFQEREGVPLTFMPFFIKAVVDAIKEFPYVNAVWSNNKIVLKKEINISVAVGTEEALYVPVIHDADSFSIRGLAKKVFQLATKTRSGNLNLSETQGGTFTVNNTGSFGSVASKPIINYPQAVILSFESIVKRPVVIDQMIGIRDMINLCLSLDHRILDGVMVGKFLKRVKEILEAFNPQTVI